ncbi:MAG: rRNA pseudouridine synthase [bacterium]|nr:rRNA pseudouridine synthase [bacterium]
MKTIRLNRFMALAGVASRRRCDELIKSGRVKIDNEVVVAPGTTITPSRQTVTYNGRALVLVPPVTYLLNKPRGIISTAKDPQGNPTVVDLAREAGIKERIYPVGRLDKDSHGLMVLTNEGELANRLIHPRYGVEKVYHVRLNLPITKTQMKRFASGLELTDGRTRVCGIVEVRGRAIYRVILKEGRKRQIRRMFEHLNRRVVDLQRVKIGPLALGNLAEGALKELTGRDLTRLKNIIGLR